MSTRPRPFLLGCSLLAFGMGVGSYATERPGGWDGGYWVALAVMAIGAAGVALYVHRAVEWLKGAP